MNINLIIFLLKPERPTLEFKKKKDFNINYFEFTGG